MRIVIKLESDKGYFTLPVHYNHIVQGFIYRNLPEKTALKYHLGGYSLGKRIYKLFVFSRLFSNSSKLLGDTLHLSSPVWFKLGAYHEDILEDLSLALLKKERLFLGKKPCRLSSIEVEMPIGGDGSFLVKAISPITVHRSFVEDGKKKTYYFSPEEEGFKELVFDNLRRKAMALEMDPPSTEGCSLEPVKLSPGNLKIIKYKGYIIKGWLGLYKVTLPRPYFELAYLTGLGSRNSQGFGMIDVVKKL